MTMLTTFFSIWTRIYALHSAIQWLWLIVIYRQIFFALFLLFRQLPLLLCRHLFHILASRTLTEQRWIETFLQELRRIFLLCQKRIYLTCMWVRFLHEFTFNNHHTFATYICYRFTYLFATKKVVFESVYTNCMPNDVFNIKRESVCIAKYLTFELMTLCDWLLRKWSERKSERQKVYSCIERGTSENWPISVRFH